MIGSLVESASADLLTGFLALCSHIAASREFLTRSRKDSVDDRLLVVDFEAVDALWADAGVAILDTLSVSTLAPVTPASLALLSLSLHKAPVPAKVPVSHHINKRRMSAMTAADDPHVLWSPSRSQIAPSEARPRRV